MSRETHPNFDLVEANMETALGGFFTALYRDSGWIGGYSRDIDDFFWNMIVPVNERPETDLSEVMEFFSSLDRDPTLYGEEEWIDDFVERNDISGLEVKFTDAWMRFEGDYKSASDEFSYVKVDSEIEKEKFVGIFAEAFGGGSEEDPYGGLGEGYHKGVMKTLNGVFGADSCENILVNKDGKFVGIGTLAVKEDVAFIYNIATLPDHQGEGIGTAATRKALESIDDREVEDIILQTEADSYVEDFYKRMGFKTFMRMKGLTGL
jgi:ribosomal protein S18 acetylase RimI-like enzyme